MTRWSVLAVGAVVTGAAILHGTVLPTPRAAGTADAPNPAPHRTAVLNIAAVMRDFRLAKYRVVLLNEKKNTLSKNVMAWRGEYIELQKAMQANPAAPNKDQATQRMLELVRKIEDEDRQISKLLNDEASVIIADLHDKIKAATDRVAERDGFELVLAYPDAVTAEEMKSPYIKELKLKPPAAQPFSFSRDIDVTERVLKLLNEKHPPLDPETGKPVDVTKLADPVAPAVLPAAPKIELPPLPGAPKP